MKLKRERNPVNKIVLPYDQIKAYDMDTEMTVELYNEDKKADVNDITFFILSNSIDEYVNVDDYSVENGTVTFKMPKVDTDKYYPQIMDRQGVVYSSADTHFIDVVYNRESRVNELFPVIKKEVIEHVAPAVKQYVMDNKKEFSIVGKQGIQGPKGDKGDTGPRGFKGNRGPKGDKGDTGDIGPQGEQGERGYRGNRGPEGPMGPMGPMGPKGADGTMTFEDLTTEQIESLRGEQGPQGDVGPQGPEGRPGEDGAVLFDELTPEQVEMLKGPAGPKGEDGSVDFDSLTNEQLMLLTPDFELDDEGNLYVIRGAE